MLVEKFEVLDGLKIKYLFKPRKYDCNYLIVVFSGFGSSNYFTYDLKKSLLNINANVLWIKDDFENDVSYYYSVKGKLVHSNINAFIENIAKKNNVKKENIILSGFSKGGTAAILFGVIYNYKNIICTVPQFKIATYCQKTKKDDVIEHMGFTANELDQVVIDSIHADSDLNKNIYFLTSEADEQYVTQVKPHLNLLYKYQNFNLFYSESILVRGHSQVTSHHLQLIMSWYYSLISGAIPKYGISVVKGDDKSKLENIDFNDVFVELRRFSTKDKVIFPEGVALVKGVDHEKWHDVDFTLILENDEKNYSFELAQDNNLSLTKEFYEDHYTVYDKSWFCSYKYKGIDLVDVAAGKYVLKLRLNLKNYSRNITVNLTSSVGDYSSDYINLCFDKSLIIEFK